MSAEASLCTCPLETSQNQIGCSACLKFSADKTNAKYCCVYCENQDGSPPCQAASTLTQASCSEQRLVCPLKTDNSPYVIAGSIVGVLLFFIALMTRTIWVPKLTLCLKNLKQKVVDLPIPGIRDNKRQSAIRSYEGGSTSIENLMGIQSISVEMVDPSTKQRIPINTSGFINFNRVATSETLAPSAIYAEAIPIHEFSGEDEQNAFPVGKS